MRRKQAAIKRSKKRCAHSALSGAIRGYPAEGIGAALAPASKVFGRESLALIGVKFGGDEFALLKN
jgi:hypothetical protein